MSDADIYDGESLSEESAKNWLKALDNQIIPDLKGTQKAEDITKETMESLYGILQFLPDPKNLESGQVDGLKKAIQSVDDELKRLNYDLIDTKSDTNLRGRIQELIKQLDSAGQETPSQAIGTTRKNIKDTSS